MSYDPFDHQEYHRYTSTSGKGSRGSWNNNNGCSGVPIGLIIVLILFIMSKCSG